MDKNQLSESDICTKFITPALKSAGWDEMSQIRGEAGQDILSLEQVRCLKIPFICLKEQRRIVGKVEELLDLSNGLETSLANNETNSRHLLAAVLHEALERTSDAPKAEAAE